MRKTHNFRDWVKSRASRQGQSLEYSRQKFWKVFLSVFRDWKFYPRESCEVSHENLWVPSRLEPPPANKSPDWAVRNDKNSNFATGTLTRQWDAKNFCVGLWLGHVIWSTSRTGQNRFFEIFLTFLQKQKTFQKQLKHLKIFLCLINKDGACENKFNQVQSHKWI